MFKKLRKIGVKGFSLVELMVVVAIIGILASVAIPNFRNFQSKARQAEAKTQLSALFTAEVAYFTEWGTYFADFRNLGLCPTGNLTYRYGFGVAGVANAVDYVGPGALAGMAAVQFNTSIAALCTACGCAEVPYGGQAFTLLAPVANAMAATFTSEARGNIDADATMDIWRINQVKDFSVFVSDL